MVVVLMMVVMTMIMMMLMMMVMLMTMDLFKDCSPYCYAISFVNCTYRDAAYTVCSPTTATSTVQP